MKPRGRGIPGLPSLDIPKAVAATLDESLTGIRERHATLSKLTKFSPSSAYWRRLHMDIGVLLEAYDRQILLLDTVSPSTVKGAAEHVQAMARADRAEADAAALRAETERLSARLAESEQACAFYRRTGDEFMRERDALRAVLEGIEASLGDGAMSFVMRRNIAALKRQHGIGGNDGER